MNLTPFYSSLEAAQNRAAECARAANAARADWSRSKSQKRAAILVAALAECEKAEAACNAAWADVDRAETLAARKAVKAAERAERAAQPLLI